jgi:amicyanin
MKTLLDDRRLLLPVLMTALAIAVGAVLIVMLSDDASGAASTSTSSAPAAKGAVTIDIADFKFKPISVTVKAGTKVTWVNRDTAPHTATVGGAGGFDTDTLKKGDRKTLRLKKPGTYAYVCEFHPFMKGTVVVE